jgi:hypothetical protein
VISLKHPVTGHEIRTDEASVKFWEASGYRAAEQDAPKPKAAPRKRAAKKSDS